MPKASPSFQPSIPAPRLNEPVRAGLLGVIGHVQAFHGGRHVAQNQSCDRSQYSTALHGAKIYVREVEYPIIGTHKSVRFRK